MTDLRDTPSPADSTPPPVSVWYWIGEGDLAGADEFRSTLAEAYPGSTVDARQGDLGGGLYTLVIHIVASISLGDVARLILDGVAFDLIKLGARNLVLRPLLKAQKKLRERHPHDNDGDIASLTLQLADTTVVVDADSRVEQRIVDSIGELLTLLARHDPHLTLPSGERPSDVYVPVIEDTSENPVSRFRAVLEVDEVMPISKSVFFQYWGVTYQDGAKRVFDVDRRLLLDIPFVRRDEYWQRMEARWESERSSS